GLVAVRGDILVAVRAYVLVAVPAHVLVAVPAHVLVAVTAHVLVAVTAHVLVAVTAHVLVGGTLLSLTRRGLATLAPDVDAELCNGLAVNAATGLHPLPPLEGDHRRSCLGTKPSVRAADVEALLNEDQLHLRDLFH